MMNTQVSENFSAEDTASDSPPTLEQIVDLKRYPIHDLEHPKTKALINACRERLDDDGCALIKDFMLPDSLARMSAEADRLYDQTFWSSATHNPYFTKDDPTLDASHPKRHFEQRSSGYINSDILEADSDLRAIYTSPVVTRFLGECLNVWPLYCWSDPLGCNPYSVINTFATKHTLAV